MPTPARCSFAVLSLAALLSGPIVFAQTAKSEDLFKNPIHPYTKALFSAVPVADPKRKKKRILLPGDPPSPLNPPKGCRFHPRCPLAESICSVEEPPAVMAEEGHVFTCHVLQRELKLEPMAAPARAT